MSTSNGIQDCSIVLFVITERVPEVKKYRNAFEAIRQRVIDHIAEAPRPQARQSISDLSTEFCQEGADMAFDSSFEQISQILASMSGDDWAAAWDDVDCGLDNSYGIMPGEDQFHGDFAPI